MTAQATPPAATSNGMSPDDFIALASGLTLFGFVAYDPARPDHILFSSPAPGGDGNPLIPCPGNAIPKARIERLVPNQPFACLGGPPGVSRMWSATLTLKPPTRGRDPEVDLFYDLLVQISASAQTATRSEVGAPQSSGCGCGGAGAAPRVRRHGMPDCPEGCRPHLYCCGHFPNPCSEVCEYCDCGRGTGASRGDGPAAAGACSPVWWGHPTDPTRCYRDCVKWDGSTYREWKTKSPDEFC